MSCIECIKKNKELNCKKCEMPFKDRQDLYIISNEEEAEMGFFKGVVTVGIAVAIVAVVASIIYWIYI